MSAPSLVLGTAGHIDHGKTALIRALTGIDTDRLPEEKSRGITIALGFAPLDLAPGLRLGVIDVPGHEGLVRTMIGGATGIDLVLLVVAADEGVMPQTREHLAICELLDIRCGVVALTKIDVAEPEVAELATEEVREALAPTGLAEAPLVPVSAHTGEGLEALRAALLEAARTAAARTPRSGPARLGVDRVFAARGFGAVVTGTLVGGPVAVGDELEILGGRQGQGEGRRGRVRGLQSFGVDTERALPGLRTAINLQGVDVAELSPGLVVAQPGAVAPTSLLDTELRWLADAPAVEDAASVEFLAGTATRRGRVAPIGADRLESGGSGFARIHLDDGPLALLPGDRFVLRGFARTNLGGATLGGGRVLDTAPPHRRRSDPELLAELAVLAAGDASAAIQARVARCGFAGLSRESLRFQTGLRDEDLSEILTSLREEQVLCATTGGIWLGAERVARLERMLLERLDAFHAGEPMRPGIQRSTLAGALPENVAPGVYELLLERLSTAGAIESEGEYIARPDHVPILNQRQEAMAAHLRAEAMSRSLEPRTFAELQAELAAPPEELRELLAYLERDGSLVRAPGDLWFDKVAVDELRGRVVAHLAEHGSLDTGAYKALIGTTRKFAVPLMELLDNEHLTIRRGEARVLRRR